MNRCSSRASVSKSFKGVQALAESSLEVRARRDPRPGRAERLGQVDLHQRGERPLPGRRRLDPVRGRGADRHAGAPHRARGHRAYLPDPAAVRALTVLRQRRAAADVRRRWSMDRAGARSRGVALARIHRPRGQGARAARPSSTCTSASSSSSRARWRRGRSLLFLDEVLSGLTPGGDGRAVRLMRAHPRPGRDHRLRRARDARRDGAYRPRRGADLRRGDRRGRCRAR